MATKSKKNPAAVALGRLGGLKGGLARTASMTPEQRKVTARKSPSTVTPTTRAILPKPVTRDYIRSLRGSLKNKKVWAVFLEARKP